MGRALQEGERLFGITGTGIPVDSTGAQRFKNPQPKPEVLLLTDQRPRNTLLLTDKRHEYYVEELKKIHEKESVIINHQLGSMQKELDAYEGVKSHRQGILFHRATNGPLPGEQEDEKAKTKRVTTIVKAAPSVREIVEALPTEIDLILIKDIHPIRVKRAILGVQHEIDSIQKDPRHFPDAPFNLTPSVIKEVFARQHLPVTTEPGLMHGAPIQPRQKT